MNEIKLTINEMYPKCAKLTLTPTETRLKVNRKWVDKNPELFKKLFQKAVDKTIEYLTYGGISTVRACIPYKNIEEKGSFSFQVRYGNKMWDQIKENQNG